MKPPKQNKANKTMTIVAHHFVVVPHLLWQDVATAALALPRHSAPARPLHSAAASARRRPLRRPWQMRIKTSGRTSSCWKVWWVLSCEGSKSNRMRLQLASGLG